MKFWRLAAELIHMPGAELQCDLAETLARLAADGGPLIGARIMDRIRDWPRRFLMVGGMRGPTLMIGIEFVRDQATKEHDAESSDRMETVAFEGGLRALSAGRKCRGSGRR